ncbi:MAG: lamin tail domain-containing protein [Cyclobacteriaceae bacterium]|nr:lamin tail domain-containing protein [Cyclobacteriaceae bacterium]
MILFLITNVCSAQFTDNFSDGNFTSNPTWTGDNAKFVINSGRLKLQAPAVAETAYLLTPSQAIHAASWEFYLQMDFNPSSTNLANIYLVSDQANVTGNLNGYFVKAGNTDDEISLYRQSGSTVTEIIDGLNGRLNLSTVQAKIKVTRDAAGGWQLFSDVGVTGTYILEGSVTDNTFTSSSFFGIECVYTSTRSTSFWFGDFVVTGTPVPDTTPPTIVTTTTVNAQQVRLVFSESLDATSAQNPSNYTIPVLGNPAAAVLPDQRTVQLDYASSFTNGVTYALQVANVKDVAGNSMAPVNVNVLFFQPVPVKNKDVIFTEFLPDPSPQIGLPNAEFIELYNRSLNPFNVSGWKLSDGSSEGIFPSQIILPGEYWIVTSSSTASFFSSFGKTISLANFPTLNNSGDVLTLKSASNLTLDSIKYDLSWYRDEDKEEGGWSIELIDPNNPCGEQDNWAASEDPKGGTPGKQNSIFANKPDLTPPVLRSAFPDSPTRVVLQFDEKLQASSLAVANLAFTPARAIAKATFTDIGLRSIQVDLSEPLSIRQLYSLEVRNITDCSGNQLQPVTLNFGLPEKADSLDVIINEVLFNPRSGGVDFVEVFNSSSKFLNLSNWKISNFENGIPTNINSLFIENQLLPPGAFAVFTTNPSIVKMQYPQSIETNLYKTNLPTLSDDDGSLAVLTDQGKIIDELSYSKNWHSPFIKSDEGISLERIAVNASSNNPDNWTSASSVIGFATPGFVNSQSRPEGTVDNGEVLVTPELFSAGDAANDYVQIQYHFEQSGWVANVKVLDVQGRLIKTIANNETLGPQGFFRWDGDRDEGGKARMGYYFVWFEIFDSSGTVKTFRKRVIVSAR